MFTFNADQSLAGIGKEFNLYSREKIKQKCAFGDKIISITSS